MARHSFTVFKIKRVLSLSVATSSKSVRIFSSVPSIVWAIISFISSFNELFCILPASKCTLSRIWSSAFFACMFAEIILFFASSGLLSIKSLAASVCIITVVME